MASTGIISFIIKPLSLLKKFLSSTLDFQKFSHYLLNSNLTRRLQARAELIRKALSGGAAVNGMDIGPHLLHQHSPGNGQPSQQRPAMLAYAGRRSESVGK